MICTKCKANLDIVPPPTFCPYCGKKLIQTQKRRTKSRGNGTGTAFKRGSTWTAQVVYDRVYVADDKPLKKLTRSKGGFKTRDEALQYCRILKAGPVKPVTAPALETYWRNYEENELAALSESKRTAYRIAWNKLSKLHSAQVDQLTVADLREAVAAAAPTYYTAKDCRTVLASLFKLAAADGYANKDLPGFIKLPSLTEQEREPFSETEQASLWKLYESGDIRAAIPLLMIYTGLMPGEAFDLTVSMIDLEGGQIVGAGKKTKVRKQTPVMIAASIIPLLEDLIAHARPSGRLFTASEDNWRKGYYDALEAAGCRKLQPYSCRHTTATALAITEGVAPQTVRKVMRWSTTRMLDRYAHPDQQDAREAVNQIGVRNRR